jgi:hypothetical protein
MVRSLHRQLDSPARARKKDLFPFFSSLLVIRIGVSSAKSHFPPQGLLLLLLQLAHVMTPSQYTQKLINVTAIGR